MLSNSGPHLRKANPPRRLKIVEVSNDVIVEIMKFAVANRVPDDARAHSVFQNPQKNTFSVVVESSEYEEVAEGNMIPVEGKIPVISSEILSRQIDREMQEMQKKTLKILK
jgi:hypothetical protein